MPFVEQEEGLFRTKNRRKNSQSLQAKGRGNYKTLKNR